MYRDYMKAWIVWYGDQWCVLLHAETREKARVVAMALGLGDSNYIQYRPIRIPKLDNIPINYKNAEDAGFHYLDDYDGVPIEEKDFYNDCKCKICMGT